MHKTRQRTLPAVCESAFIKCETTTQNKTYPHTSSVVNNSLTRSVSLYFHCWSLQRLAVFSVTWYALGCAASPSSVPYRITAETTPFSAQLRQTALFFPYIRNTGALRSCVLAFSFSHLHGLFKLRLSRNPTVSSTTYRNLNRYWFRRSRWDPLPSVLLYYHKSIVLSNICMYP